MQLVGAMVMYCMILYAVCNHRVQLHADVPRCQLSLFLLHLCIQQREKSRSHGLFTSRLFSVRVVTCEKDAVLNREAAET